jgi:hypothetical protein
VRGATLLTFDRNENALVLSENLNENAVQILVDVALSKRFPEQCSKLHAATRDIREISHKEMTRKQDLLCEELRGEERSLWRALREAVVNDVVKLFP